MSNRANKRPSRKPGNLAEVTQQPTRIQPLGTVTQRHETYEGPVPPPEILERFELLVPGTARAMLEHATEESVHRRKLEEITTIANVEVQRRALDLDETRSKAIGFSDFLGQTFGVIVSLSCIGGAIFLAMNGHEGVAGALTVLPSAAVIQAFFAKRTAPGKPAPSKEKK